MHTPYLLWLLLISILIPDGKALVFDEADAIPVKGHRFGTTKHVKTPNKETCVTFFSKREGKYWYAANDSGKSVIFQVKEAKSTDPWGDTLVLPPDYETKLPIRKARELNVRFPRPVVEEPPQLTKEPAGEAPPLKELPENHSGPKDLSKQVGKKLKAHVRLPRIDDEENAPPLKELTAKASRRKQVSKRVRHTSMSQPDQKFSIRKLLVVLFLIPLLFKYSGSQG